MKKLITTIAIMALSTVSAKAIDMEMFSITGGLATNQSVFGGTAKQDAYDAVGTTIEHTDKEHGVFQESFGSQFVELGIGRWISVGFEHVPDSISTPENINSGGNEDIATADTAKVSVDFNDMNTTYLKINTPMGIYFKYGTVSTDLDIKETMLSGNTYKNTSVDGTSMGAGYQKTLGERGFGFRIEGNYVDLDNVTVNNGVGSSTSGGTTANGGFNEVKATNLEGLTGKVALTYTFGRSGNSF